MRLLDRPNPNFGWTGEELITGETSDPFRHIPPNLRGAYAGVWAGKTVARLIRDPLGINKLFWAPGDDGARVVAARPRSLVDAGRPFEEICAIPAGSVIELDLQTGREQVETLELPRRSPGGGQPIEVLAEEIRATLNRYCAALAAAHPDAPVYVCLSGGLDSSGIAVLARNHFRNVTAVSFDLEHEDGVPSADRRAAEQLANDLGMPLLTVTVTEEELLEGLDTALAEGIDWRDFNVHAALVNVALARGISRAREAGTQAAPLVLTGDLSNEFIVDYHPEQYRGRTYYALPRLDPLALQYALVRGLETSHREVGPFQAWGLSVVQVYAVVVDHYLALSPAFLAEPSRKDRLTRLVFGRMIPDYIYARPKTRAQLGDPDAGRGVLGVCVDRGIDQAWLRRRFAELHGVTDQRSLEGFIRAGRYRTVLPGLGDFT